MVIMSNMDNINQDVQDFHKLHPNRKLAVFGIILFVFIISILIGVYFSKGSFNIGNETTETTIENPEGTTNLTLVPSSETVAPGETITVSVMLDGDAVQAVDVAINFDPALFAASEVTNGDVYDDILRQSVENGQVLVSAAVSPSNPDALNTGELFSFTLEALDAGSTELTFDTDLTITAKNGTNTLQSAQGVTVTAQ